MLWGTVIIAMKKKSIPRLKPKSLVSSNTIYNPAKPAKDINVIITPKIFHNYFFAIYTEKF